MQKTLLFLSLSFALLACSIKKADLESPAINKIKSGEKFRINLPEDHSGGFTWLPNNQFNSKVISYINSVWHGKEKGVDFNFEALEKGKTDISFYSIMYKDTAAVKHFIIEVE